MSLRLLADKLERLQCLVHVSRSRFRLPSVSYSLSQVLLTLRVALYKAVVRFYGVSSIVLTGLGIRHIVVALILSFVQTLNGGNSSSLPLTVEA